MTTARPLTVIAIDDEPLALRRLSLAIEHLEGFVLVGTARGGEAGIDLVREMRPDILLLDINMAEFDGFNVLDELADEAPLVIFVTAFQEYAVRAFEVRAFDYLLKPIEFDRLRSALESARGRLSQEQAIDRAQELQEVVDALRENRRQELSRRYDREIWAPWGGSHERLSIDEIDWVESEGDYVRLHARGKTYLMRDTMARMEEKLDPELFRRVHRSALVYQPKVQRIDHPAPGRYVLVLNTDARVPVGRSYLKRVKGWIAHCLAANAAVANEAGI
jgi:DNA-binding LytR/AlgR family response regulator